MFSSTELLYMERRTLHGQRFKKLSSLKAAYCQLFLNVLVGLVVVGITCFKVAIIYLNKETETSLYCCQAVFWSLSFMFHCKYSGDHWFLKLGGHFKFYTKVKKYAFTLCFIPSLFNVIVICLQAAFNRYGCLNSTSSPLFPYILGGVISFEIFITLPVIISYIILGHKFNQIKPVPDTEQYEYLLPCDARSSSEIGYRLDGEAVADVLEKQADLIYYLKSTVAELNLKLAARS